MGLSAAIIQSDIEELSENGAVEGHRQLKQGAGLHSRDD